MNTLQERISEVRWQTAAVSAVAVVGMAASLAAAAQVRIPLPWTPVPITLQTLVVLLGAAWLGSGRSLAGIGLYGGAVAAGLPLLSGWRGGLVALTGPTGGYIVGWLAAAYLIGRLLAGQRAGWARVVAVFVAAEALILACGLLHLALLLQASWSEALWMGVWPFLPGDLLKVAVAAALYRAHSGANAW